VSQQHALAEQVVNELVGADGYRARVTPSEDGRLRIEIVAGPEACADCLVPKGIMRMVILDRLAPGTALDEDDIRYPEEGEPGGQ
jgi:hypothetical protein